MKNGGIIAIVATCIVAAGAGIFFMTRKPKGADKTLSKEEILALLPENERADLLPILEKMTPQELGDTAIIIQSALDIEARKTTREEVFKKYPGLEQRQDAISKKYNIFT